MTTYPYFPDPVTHAPTLHESQMFLVGLILIWCLWSAFWFVACAIAARVRRVGWVRFGLLGAIFGPLAFCAAVLWRRPTNIVVNVDAQGGAFVNG